MNEATGTWTSSIRTWMHLYSPWNSHGFHLVHPPDWLWKVMVFRTSLGRKAGLVSWFPGFVHQNRPELQRSHGEVSRVLEQEPTGAREWGMRCEWTALSTSKPKPFQPAMSISYSLPLPWTSSPKRAAGGRPESDQVRC